jgi:hypothetical protein
MVSLVHGERLSVGQRGADGAGAPDRHDADAYQRLELARTAPRCSPNALDFASGAQFWTLFTDLTENLIGAAGVEKTFDFINRLPNLAADRFVRG